MENFYIIIIVMSCVVLSVLLQLIGPLIRIPQFFYQDFFGTSVFVYFLRQLVDWLHYYMNISIKTIISNFLEGYLCICSDYV